MAKAAQALKEPVQEDLLKELVPTENPELPVEITEPETKPDEEAEIQVEETPEVDDASVALQKQVEALKKSEELQRNRNERLQQQLEESQKVAQDRAAEVGKSRKDILQANLNEVSTALAAHQEAIEAAERDMETAWSNQDQKLHTEAVKRMTRAQANLSQLEAGKLDLEAKLKAPEPEQPKNQLPDRIQRWMNRNQKLIQNPETFADIQSFHYKILKEGYDFDSDEYIEAMEDKLGLRQDQEQEEEPAVPERKPQVQTKQVPVSAPVSREGAPSPDGSRGGIIKLTPAQREAARISGLSEKDYATQLIRINRMKANGSYGGQQ